MSNSISGNYSNHFGVSGLASGMDTESIVKKMMAASSARIDKVNQQKQLLQWKQEDYKSIIYKLMSFKDKYFNTSSSGSLSSAFYSSKNVTAQNAADSAFASITVSDSSNIASFSLQNINVATNSVAKSQGLVSKQITVSFDGTAGQVDLTGKTAQLTVDGITKTITFSKSYDSLSLLATDIKQLADDAFGVDRLTVTTAGDNIILNSDGANASLSPGTTNDAFSTTGIQLINSQTGRIDISKSIAENNFATPVTGDSFAFFINDKRFEFSKDTSISAIMNSINNSDAGVTISYSSITDRFTLTSDLSGAAGTLSLTDETGNLLSSIFGSLNEANYTQGTDASVYINGAKVTRSSNTFTIDGVTYNLKANTDNTIQYNVTNDTDKAVTNIKNFVNDYNELLETLNSKVGETRYRDFNPLTDEQKSELSDTDREKWEEKAKSGLLKNDGTLQNIIASLRELVYTPVAQLADNTSNLPISLASIGIGTADYRSKGKLVIDEKKLVEAISNNSDAVINLFTQKSDKIYLPDNTPEVKAERYKESGLMYRISDILENSVRTTFGSGSLLQIAGLPGSSTEKENYITKSISRYEKKLDQLLDSFTREESRYFSQFTAMEKYISQMNQQSQWLSNNMG